MQNHHSYNVSDYDLREGIEAPILGPFLKRLYLGSRPSIQPIIRKAILNAEGGEARSLTFRKILGDTRHISVGIYSTGACMHPGYLRPFTTVGRFCEFDPTVRTFNANHPRNLVSTHAFFFEPLLGYSKKELISRTNLKIEHDVYIGRNSVVTAATNNIAVGAIIQPNTVVFQDVPPYAIIQGNPGRIVGFRFPKDTISELLASNWWDKPTKDLPTLLKSIITSN